MLSRINTTPLCHFGGAYKEYFDQVKLYQAVNTLTRLEYFDQLAKILGKRVPGKHHQKHRLQGLLTAINSLPI
jgi:hypothetical protein